MKKPKFIDFVLLIVAAFPGLFFSYYAIGEPWTSFRLARLILSIQQNHIAEYLTSASAYRVEHLGSEFIETMLLITSKWSAEWLGLLPLGSILFVMIYFALAFKLSQSRWLSLLIAIYVGWYYPRLVSQYSIQTYVWTNMLFLGFLIVFLEWIHRKRLGHSILIILLFITTFLFYQTTPVWIIAAICTASILLFFRKRKHPMGSKVTWALPILCIVIYLAFDTVLYNNFLQRFSSEVDNIELLQSIASKIFAPLTETDPCNPESIRNPITITSNSNLVDPHQPGCYDRTSRILDFYKLIPGN